MRKHKGDTGAEDTDRRDLLLFILGGQKGNFKITKEVTAEKDAEALSLSLFALAPR